VNDKKALTINSFIDTCIKEIDQFSLIELEKRKRLTWKDATENEMESYLREAYEPTKDDFNSLKKAAEQHIKNHTEIYKPIRNKLLAHKNISFLQKSNDLFANTNVRDIEATLLFLHQVVSVVRQLLIDGTKTNLKDYCLRLDNDLMKKDIEQILEKLI
jgi:hypothetical protein